MGNVYEMMAVAEVCPKYMPTYNRLESSTVGPNNKSCKNCGNFKNGICQVDYYDKIVASLDQC